MAKNMVRLRTSNLLDPGDLPLTKGETSMGRRIRQVVMVASRLNVSAQAKWRSSWIMWFPKMEVPPGYD